MSQEKLNIAKRRIGNFSQAVPELFIGLKTISNQATKGGEFDSASKELIATAIAVAKGCEDCIYYHVDGARRHGATEEQLLEVLEIAVEMGGGPAIMYGSKALEFFKKM
jgi:AhpD family alkylhydroperoxidase|tara:strand:- start:1933 stop:2259 length:327 start_codon:yes stop_codon:yes gene_type:complete